jgi:hypothetical protein
MLYLCSIGGGELHETSLISHPYRQRYGFFVIGISADDTLTSIGPRDFQENSAGRAVFNALKILLDLLICQSSAAVGCYFPDD